MCLKTVTHLIWLQESAGYCGFNLSMQQVNDSYLRAAFAVQYVGLFLECCFFFARAYNPQNLYCQTV
jgi:hypothetical protein